MNAVRSRRGFTLVELLVVIGIIGLLAAIITPVVMQSLTKARNAAIKAEIDMLHMAMMNYQSEYGVLPPCIDSQFATAPASYKAGGEAAKHLKRIFPRCADPAAQLNGVGSIPLNPSNALVAWLSGFTTNPTSPLIPGGARVKLYDFDKSRIDTSTAAYFPSGKRGSPYIFFDSGRYGTLIDPNSYSDGTNVYSPQIQKLANGAQAFFNADTFQILSAGRDEQFGTDDDLSNFWTGTKREYLDSLKD